MASISAVKKASFTGTKKLEVTSIAISWPPAGRCRRSGSDKAV